MEILNSLVSFFWGPPMIIIIVGGGLYLAVISRFANLKYFFHAISLLRSKSEKNNLGQITRFQALTNALSATVGLGNIAGVAVAISQGGAGAVFWMWISAFFGMNTKFFEVSLSMIYRGKDHKGEVQGGPMYVMESLFPKIGKSFAIFFSIAALIGTLGIFQVNQLSAYLNSSYQITPWVTGLLCAVFIFIIISGGVKRIGAITAILVPLMCSVYLVTAVIILIFHFDRIPELFYQIFHDAFTGKAAVGGVAGLTVAEVIKTGLKRAAFSNEAGMGTAPMAHSNAKTDDPISEGLVAMLGPFLDTIVVCTITAIVILLGLEQTPQEISGITLTMIAFTNLLPRFGPQLLGMATILFSLTTMLGMANYNQKAWSYLFQGRLGSHYLFYLYYCGTLVLASVIGLEIVINAVDLAFALMAIPNMIITLYCAKIVQKKFNEYKKRHSL